MYYDQVLLMIEYQIFEDLKLHKNLPLKRIVPRITTWSIPWAMIFLHIYAVIKPSNREYGLLCKSSSLGGSVARARAAKVSIIRLTHNICIGVNGDYLRKAAPVNANINAEKLTVSWNCKNLRIESKIFRPHFIAVTIELKLSSNRIIPEAYFATSVPVIPIANPISALLRAGASLVPSPVMATTWFNLLRPVAIRYLSEGDDLAKTLKF